MELFEGPVIGAIESAFVADYQGESLAVIGELLEDPSQAIDVAHVLELLVDVLGAAHDFGAQQGGFDARDAAQAPAGGDHGLDQIHLDSALGIELIGVGIEKSQEVLLRFGGQDDGFCGESVAQAVAGRGGAAFGRDGTVGLGAIGAGGFGFEFG
jgi:hypothetical protein